MNRHPEGRSATNTKGPGNDPSRADSDALREPAWGLGEPAWGFLLAQVSGLILGSAIIALAGQEASTVDRSNLPLWAIVLQAPPLWIGFVAAPVWAARRYGNGVRRDFRIYLHRRDIAPALAIGIFAQLVLVPVVSWPVLKLTGSTTEDLAEAARILTDKADTPASIVLLVAVVVVGAPIAEELFFRGLLMGAIAKRWTTTTAVLGSAAIFGASHFQPLQFPALATAGLVFAGCVAKTKRLGPAIIAHMAFNATTVVALMWP
jgi:membrane protease YdiL (CAAX protease family)